MANLFQDIFDQFRAWFQRNFAAAVKMIGGSGTAYVVSYPVNSRYALPPDFKLASYMGLVLCTLTSDHLVRIGGLVSAYWQDETSYRAIGGIFEADLSLGRPTGVGLLNRVELQPNGSWWTKFQTLPVKTLLGLLASCIVFIVAVLPEVMKPLATVAISPMPKILAERGMTDTALSSAVLEEINRIDFEVREDSNSVSKRGFAERMRRSCQLLRFQVRTSLSKT